MSPNMTQCDINLDLILSYLSHHNVTSVPCMCIYNNDTLSCTLCVYYRIRQNIRGGKLSRFSRILAKRESFTIESFPSSQLENFIIIP